MADLAGNQIDKYHLIKRLGIGTFGDVYQGKNVQDEEIVAVKILKFELTKETLIEFLNEARSMFHLKHTNIVPLLDFGTDNISMAPFLVMAYAPHGTLRQRHPVGTRVPLETVISYMKPIAAALQYAHDKRLVHRDVKPSNILIGDNNTILLSDFGVAITAHNEGSLSTQNMSGTLPYMAPEQIQGHPCAASDQYALAIMVYEWLCGERPFPGTETEIIDGHRFQPPPPLHTKNPAVPPAIEQIILQALTKKPQDRYPNIQAFSQAFEQAYKQLSSPKVTLTPPSLPKPSSPSPPPLVTSMPVLPNNTPIPYQPARATLPLTPHAPDPVPETPRQSRSSRQLPATAIGGAIAGSATASVSTPPRNSASRSFGAPPSRSTTPGGGGGSGGRQSAKRRSLLLIGLIILLIALLLCGGLVFTQPTNSISRSVLSALGLSSSSTISSTVVITPDSKPISNTYTLTGANTTDAVARTLATRQISATAQSQPVQVNATGSAVHAAAQAHGSITFFNSVAAAQQVNAGIRFPIGGGVTLVTDADAFIPAANLPTTGQKTVSAHAEPSGRAGNVGALVLNGVGCCGAGIVVSNNTAFTGGQDATNYRFLQASDVTNAVTQQIKNATKQDAMSNLSKQLHTGEQPFGATQCTPVISADQALGDNGPNQPVSNANVTYRIKCTSNVYDNSGAQNVVIGLLAQKAATTLPRGYTPINNIQVSLTNQTTANNTTSFFFSGKGVWTYQFTDQQKLNIAKSIAGKTVAEAQDILKNTPGVGDATVTGDNDNNLPTDPNQFSIKLQPLAGSTPTAPMTTPTLSPPNVAAPVVQGSGGTDAK